MDQMQLFTLGRVLGWFAAAGFLIAALNPFFKEVNKRHMAKRPKDDRLRKGYQKFLRGYLRVHPYVGMAVGALMLTHLVIQFLFYGFYLSGFVAGGLMLVLIGLGVYGKYVMKKKPGPWLKLHRLLSLVLILAVAIHVVLAKVS